MGLCTGCPMGAAGIRLVRKQAAGWHERSRAGVGLAIGDAQQEGRLMPPFLLCALGGDQAEA